MENSPGNFPRTVASRMTVRGRHEPTAHAQNDRSGTGQTSSALGPQAHIAVFARNLQQAIAARDPGAALEGP